MATTKDFHTSDLWLGFLDREINIPLKAAEIVGKARIEEEGQKEECEQAVRDSKKGADSRSRIDNCWVEERML